MLGCMPSTACRLFGTAPVGASSVVIAREDGVVSVGSTKLRIISSDNGDDNDDDEDGADVGGDARDLDEDSERRLLHALGCNDGSSSLGSEIESALGD